MFIDPAVAGNVLYIGSCSGRLLALDAVDGTVEWSYDTAADSQPPGQFHGQFHLGAETLLVGTDSRGQGYVYAVARGDGEVRWKQGFARGVTTDMRVRDDGVFFASEVGDVVRLDAATGETVWHADGAAGLEGGARPLDPVLAEDQVIVPWRSGVVDAYAIDDGTRLWRRDLGVRLNAHPALVGETVMVGGLDGRVHRLGIRDGETTGPIDLGGVLYGDLVAAPGCVLALSARGGLSPDGGAAGPHVLSCLAPSLEEVRWQHQEVSEWGTFRPLVEGDLVVVGVEDRLLGLGLAEGEVRWELEVPGLPRGLALSGDRLYVGTQPGPVLAYPRPGMAPPEAPEAPDSSP